MIMNEYRLNPLDPNSQKIMEEQLEQFFFGAGSSSLKDTSHKSQGIKRHSQAFRNRPF